MSFAKVPGQIRGKALLDAWFRSERLPHTILISGPEGTAKRRLALELAKALHCQRAGADSCDECASCRRCDALTHPDLHVLLPTTARGEVDLEAMRLVALEYVADLASSVESASNIAREQLRVLQREMVYAPTTSALRVALLFEVDRMHVAGANSLLKTLEEPPPNAVIILVSSYPERILPTILSRCQHVPAERLPEGEIRRALADGGMARDRLEQAVRMADGSLQRALQIAAGEFDAVVDRVEEFLLGGIHGEDEVYWRVADELGTRAARGQLERFLQGCQVCLRDLLLLRCGAPVVLTHADRGDFLEQLGLHMDLDSLETAVVELDRAYESLQRNVNANLLLADLWRHLSRNGRQSTARAQD